MYKISGGKQLKECLKTALEHNLSVLISGPPGCGKSCLLYTSPSPRDS